ncbi:uncharacterized protein [Leptinotarsa decemlineata]|uniref:uncharacterized protein n=1 Tax=Leptinotarsa decemlineata TaxID=7539 RepID=UPI003D307A66
MSNSVRQHTILKTLKKWSFGANSLAFLNNFLKLRKFRVQTNGILSTTKIQENGVTLGSPLSTTLFLVVINSIIEECTTPLKARLYADDLVVFGKGKKPKTIYDCLQRFLVKLQDWSSSTGLQISEDKNKCIRFCKRYKGNLPQLQPFGKSIQYVENIKFLGMILDHRQN